MSALTSGTWQLGETEDGDPETGPTGIGVWDGTIIAMRDGDDGFPEGEEIARVVTITDARAMAAAKDLVEALEVMAEDFRATTKMHIDFWNSAVECGFIPGGQRWTYEPTECGSYIAAQNVIAKARGQEEHVCCTITIRIERKP